MVGGVFGTATSMGPFIPTIFGQKMAAFPIDYQDIFYKITIGTMLTCLILGGFTGIIGINNRNKYLFVLFAFLSTAVSIAYIVLQRKSLTVPNFI